MSLAALAPAILLMAGPQAAAAATAYACDAGRRFEVEYRPGGALAVVRVDGAVYELPHVRSASGARYAKGKVELFTKGREARLTGHRRPYRDCRAE